MISLLTLAGCKAECKNASDCNDQLACTTDTCVKKKCVHKTVPNCECGNGLCEEKKGETKCSCSQDCGPCTGQTESTYLEIACDERDECASDVIPSKIETKLLSETTAIRSGPNFNIAYEFNTPFNTKTALFNLALNLHSESNSFSNIEILKVQVLENKYITSTRREEQRLLAEKELNKRVWNTDTEVKVSLPLTVQMETEEEEKKLVLKIDYKYDLVKNSVTTGVTNTYQKVFLEKVVFLNPERSGRCPADCDDSNQCTNDICSENTLFFCEHTYVSGVCCGNNNCDSGENKCNCPADCGPCTGSVGEYLELFCSKSQCTNKISSDAIVEPITKSSEHSVRDFTVMGKYSFEEPFNLKNSLLGIELNLQNAAPSISNIKLTRFQILNNDQLLGEITPSAGIGSSSYKKTIPIDITLRDFEEKKTITVKAFFEYKKTSGENIIDMTGSYSHSLGQITFVNV